MLQPFLPSISALYEYAKAKQSERPPLACLKQDGFLLFFGIFHSLMVKPVFPYNFFTHSLTPDLKCSQLSNKRLSCVRFKTTLFWKKMLWINEYFTALGCSHYSFHSEKDDFKMSNPGFPVLSQPENFYFSIWGNFSFTGIRELKDLLGHPYQFYSFFRHQCTKRHISF